MEIRTDNPVKYLKFLRLCIAINLFISEMILKMTKDNTYVGNVCIAHSFLLSL